jgi:hypothetical protein
MTLYYAGLSKYFELLGKIMSAGSSAAFLFVCAQLRGKWPIQYHGITVSQSHAYDVCGLVLFFACLAAFIVIYRISKLIQGLDVDCLDELRIYASIWNFLADVGSSRPAQIQSSLTYGFLIAGWWLSYIAVSLLNPHELPGGLELMLVGAGILCLCALANCTSAMARARPFSDSAWFRLPLIGAVTAHDIVTVVAVVIGGSSALIAEVFVRR